MSFSYFLNMEKLTISIAEKHIRQMTNDNLLCDADVFIDENKLLNNLENGFIAITQMNCYIESFLNTILNSCIGYNEEDLLKCNIQEKIDIIFLYYGKNFSSIKSQHFWALYKKTTKVRNSLIHFKKTFIGNGTEIPKFDIGSEPVHSFFTRNNMDLLLQAHIRLAHTIAKELDLYIFDNVEVFECYGREGLTNYVVEKDNTLVCESRFE